MKEVIVFMLVFYAFAALTGRYLYVNKGERSSKEGRYTLKKVLPYVLGYAITAILIGETFRDFIAYYGKTKMWLFYGFFFMMMSLLYRTVIRLTKSFSQYFADKTANGYFAWLRERNRRAKLWAEFFDSEYHVLDCDVMGYSFATILITTVYAAIKIMMV